MISENQDCKSSLLPALIPFRDSKCLISLDTVYNLPESKYESDHHGDARAVFYEHPVPFLPLGVPPDKCRDGRTSSRTNIGRVELLLATACACTCLQLTRKRPPRPTCSRCLLIEEWALQYLSRQFIRIESVTRNHDNETNLLQWKIIPTSTNSSLVIANGMRISEAKSSHSTLGNEVDQNDKSLNHETLRRTLCDEGDFSLLNLGSSLVIECPLDNKKNHAHAKQVSPIMNRHLEFRVGWVRVSYSSISANKYRRNPVKCFQQRIYSLQEIPVKLSTYANQCQVLGSVSEKPRTQDESTCSMGQYQLHPENCLGQLVEVYDNSIQNLKPNNLYQETDFNVGKELCVNRYNSVLPSKTTTQSRSVDNGESTSKVVDLSVFFLQLGRSMSASRVKILKEILLTKIKGIVIVPTFCLKRPPKIIVLDEKLTIDSAVSALGFSTLSTFTCFIKKFCIHLVKSDWVLQSHHVYGAPPSLSMCWSGLHEQLDTSRRADDTEKDLADSSHLVKKAKVVINAMLMSSIQETSQEMEPCNNSSPSVSITIKGKSCWKNSELSAMMDTISALYKDCPLEDMDEWRSYSYKLVAARLRCIDFEVTDDPTSLSKLSLLSGFGTSVMRWVREYCETGSCRIVREFEQDPMRQGVKNINRIWGIGPKQAVEIVRLGYNSIKEVRQALQNKTLTLPVNARVGVDYYEDFLEPIARSEVMAIGNIVADACRQRYRSACIDIMGSYRRGCEYCGDIDVLISHPDFMETTPSGAIDWLVEMLRRNGRITNHLTRIDPSFFDRSLENATSNTSPYDGKLQCGKSASYMGVITSPFIPGKKRRIDIKFYPHRERATASLYFTGNEYFNRSIRLYAKTMKQLHLDDHGLYMYDPVLGLAKNKRIEIQTEREIFEVLGLVYKEPHERDAFDAVIETASKNPFIDDTSYRGS